jgi:hypothetical protein
MEYVYKFYLSDAHGICSETPFREVALPEPLEQINVGKSVQLPGAGDGVVDCQFRITRVESGATVTKVPMTLVVRVEVVRLHQTIWASPPGEEWTRSLPASE